MLATFVIGLREGLEAALIVGIIAAFLRTNRRSLAPMWLGVALAVLLSLAVGVGLALVQHALPQQAQEGLETVIGAIAVFFVAGMVVWMNAHARTLKSDLEQDAADALHSGGTFALAAMAFLAVLKEGFETSVFLLATFSASQSALLAAIGAIAGIAVAVGIGWGIYAGGVRINLSRFFRVTGAFLILVAAGLVVSTLRTAHEAGWLNAGQQKTVDLSWLVAPGSVQSALITGVLGIPADPRLVEVVGWLLFVAAMSLFVYWPVRRRPHGARAAYVQLGIAAGLVVTALVLAVIVPRPTSGGLPEAALVSSADGAPSGTARLSLPADAVGGHLTITRPGDDPVDVPLIGSDGTTATRNAIVTRHWLVTEDVVPTQAQTSLTLDQLVELGGGRLPRGIDPQRNPGPFDARWSGQRTTEVWAVGSSLYDARITQASVVTLTGGGLDTARTVTPADGQLTVVADPGQAMAVTAAIAEAGTARDEHLLWGVYLPIGLILAAIVLVVGGVRSLAGARRLERSTPSAVDGLRSDPHSTAAPSAAAVPNP